MPLRLFSISILNDIRMLSLKDNNMTSDTKHTNLYVWIGVALLLAGVGYQLGYIFTPENEMDDSGLVVSQLCFLASWIAYIVDYFKLKSMELPRPHWIWVVLNWSPVYIWKRSTMLDRDRKPFWTLMVGLVLLVGLVFITAMATEAKRSYETPLVSEKHNEGHTLSEEDRQAIKQWLQSLSYEFAEANLSSASIPVYFNKTNGGLLGFVVFENVEYIFATSVNNTRMSTCSLFSEFSYIDGTIILAQCPDATGSYDDQKDYFQFESNINDCGLCGMGVSLTGHYARIATALCERQPDDQLAVTQVFSN